MMLVLVLLDDMIRTATLFVPTINAFPTSSAQRIPTSFHPLPLKERIVMVVGLPFLTSIGIFSRTYIASGVLAHEAAVHTVISIASAGILIDQIPVTTRRWG